MSDSEILNKLMCFICLKLDDKDISEETKKILKEITDRFEELNSPPEVLCDLCKKSCNTEYGAEFAEIKASWGYPSNKDLQEHYCRLCENCYDQIAHIIQQNGGQIHVSNIGPRIFDGI